MLFVRVLPQLEPITSSQCRMDFSLFSPQPTNGSLGIGWYPHGFRYSGRNFNDVIGGHGVFLDTWHYPLAGAPGAAAGVEDWSTSRCDVHPHHVYLLCVFVSPPCALYQSSVSSLSSFVSSAFVSTAARDQTPSPLVWFQVNNWITCSCKRLGKLAP